ncbi:MAG: DnaD domain protein [Clostridia bacterium]|nr:DnaD domain protein [Clostridia bacterium]
MATFHNPNPKIALSADFVLNYMPKANHTHVMVYIYALALCARNSQEADNAHIAAQLDILESDVVKAWRYWKKAGLVSIDAAGNVTFTDSKAAPVRDDSRSGEIEPKREALSMTEISNRMSVDADLKTMITMAESLLKKPLSQKEINTLFSFMDWYSLPKEVVLMLLEHCACEDKIKNFSYIEKVAQSWSDEGITTVEAAEKLLKRRAKERSAVNRCKKIFGLERAFSDAEVAHIINWTTNWGMSETMIKEAYSRTTHNTGKLSFAYMGKILAAWSSKGIKSPAALKSAEEGLPKTRTQGANNTYDFEDIARKELQRRIAKYGGEVESGG